MNAFERYLSLADRLPLLERSALHIGGLALCHSAYLNEFGNGIAGALESVVSSTLITASISTREAREQL